MVLGSSCLGETESAARKEGGLCVCKSRVRNLGEMVAFFFFFDGTKSDWEKLHVWKKEVLIPSSFPRRFICRPVAAALRAQLPGPEDREQSSGLEIFQLGRGGESLRPFSLHPHPPSRRLESSGKGKENGEKPPPHQGLVIIPQSSDRRPLHQQ